LNHLLQRQIILDLKSQRTLEVEDLGVASYGKVWDYQKQLLTQRLDNPQLNDKLLLVEHPPVYTLGTGSTVDNLKFDLNDFSGELYRIERGGEVTYHTKGQIVVYPILNLSYYQQDLHWYLRKLEQVIIDVLKDYNIEGKRIEGLTGVWIDNNKVAAIGIKVKRWITMHGFSINVCCDLRGFGQIIPCGIKDKGVTSLHYYIPDIAIVDIKNQIVDNFVQLFSMP
jgi:lipoyl(octanoyl) transferase